MRVDFTTFGPEPAEKSQTGRATQPAATGTGASDAAASSAELDQTRFSFDQARVQSLAAQALAQPDIREAKVQSLQQAISDGEYSIPASQVADALASELGGAQG
jgi:flagellar biosynthesis anti-sigma factor FlgM